MQKTGSAAPTETRFVRRRTTIIKSAAHVFGRKGFHATTLEDIAAELQVTKASLYYYFSTKEELLYEVHLLSMHDVLNRLHGARAAFTSPAEQLHEVLTQHLRLLATDYEGAFLLQQEYDLPANYREEIIRLRDQYERGVLDIVQEGERTRVFRVKDARVAVRMVLGGVNWFLRWYRSDGRLTVEEIADAYIDFIFYGLLAPAAVQTAPTPVRAAALNAAPPTKVAVAERRRRRGEN